VQGANIARQLQARYPTLRVVVLSVHDEPVLARYRLPPQAKRRRSA